ncbi:MAG: DUF2061 domain-containing protein [Methylocella sp.]
MAYQLLGLSRTNRDMVAAIGVIAAGAAVFEAALIPGIVIGGAAVLAPKLLPTLRKRLPPLLNPALRRRLEPAGPLPARPDVRLPLAAPPRLAIKQAVAKTITFRVIVTAVDLTANYVVIGELAAAAGLSTVSLVVNPFFYFAHETAWNYFGPSFMRKFGEWGLPVLSPVGPEAKAPLPGREGFTINRALAKTITFRVFATTMDFATNYFVLRDLATAAKLTAIGFVVGPFVYFGHEKAWEYFGSPEAPAERVSNAQVGEPKPPGAANIGHA